MTTTAQYAKDASMDNSRITFCRHTGNPTGWTDTGGRAHPLPVDFQRVSAATAEQYRAYWLEQMEQRCDDATKDMHIFLGPTSSMTTGNAPIPTDEITMNRVDVAPFFVSLRSGGLTLSTDEKRQFHPEQRQRDAAADRAERERRTVWLYIAIASAGAALGAAVYALFIALGWAVVS